MLIMVDAGGVIFNNVMEDTDFFEAVATMFEIPTDEVRSGYQSREAELETGEADPVDGLLGVAMQRQCPSGVLLRGEVERAYIDRVAVNEDVLGLLGSRRWREDVVLGVANNEGETWDILKNERYQHFSRFDHVLSSWRLHAVKPSSRYFDAAFGATGIDPADALLIDDSRCVVQGAEAVGVRTVLFTDFASMEQILLERSLISEV